MYDDKALGKYRQMPAQQREAERSWWQRAAAGAQRVQGELFVEEAFDAARAAFPTTVRILWWMRTDADHEVYNGARVWRLLDAQNNVLYDSERSTWGAGAVEEWLTLAYELAGADLDWAEASVADDFQRADDRTEPLLDSRRR